MRTKVLTGLLAAAVVMTAFAPVSAAAPVATGSGELPAAFLDLITCLIQLPPSASGDPAQGCNT